MAVEPRCYAKAAVAKVGVVLSSSFTDAGEFLADARALETAGVDSVWVQRTTAGLDPWLLLAAVAAVTTRLRLGLLVTDRRQIDGSADQMATLNRLSRSRGLWGVALGRSVEVWANPNGPRERYVNVPAGDAEALVSAREADTSVLVPMSAGLLDLLRRPDQADDRSDLILSQG